MFRAMQRYADFNGRGSRSEFWLYILLVTITVCVTMLLDLLLLGDASNDEYGQPTPLFLFTGIAYLVFLIPSISAQVRRLHDTNRSGWWYLIGMIPLVGGIVLFIFSVQPGDTRRNKYGAPPKETPGRIDDDRQQGASQSFGPGSYYEPQNTFGQAPPREASAFAQEPPRQPQNAPSSRSAEADQGAWLDRLEKLAKLKAEGILTEAEFDVEKAALLAGRRG